VNENNGTGMLRPGKGAFEQYSTFCVRECVVGEKKFQQQQLTAAYLYRQFSTVTELLECLGFFSLYITMD